MNRALHYLKLVKEIHYDTYLHSLRVAMLAYNIGEIIELTSHELERLFLSALLHDIGKTKLARSILDKPGKLGAEEWGEIKKHPFYGIEILRHDHQLLSNDVIEGVYSHHEFFNGEGYPLGLRGEGIIVYARVIAIADALDAMTTKRVYRPHQLSFEDAVEEVLKCKETQFDPYICNKIAGLARNSLKSSLSKIRGLYPLIDMTISGTKE